MSLELHVRWAVSRVKVVHMDVLLVKDASEQMTAICKPNLVASLDLNLLVLLDLTAQDVAHDNFVL